MGTADDDEDGPLPPSKSQRKRDAHAAQKLGERLVAMRDADLAQLPLDETLRDAIGEARRISSHGARARQLQYIGKLMRAADMTALETALASREEAQKAHARLRR
jgi:ribosome-associated protein